MVVPMKKLQVLISSTDRETFLSELAAVGVVHISEQQNTAVTPRIEQTANTVRQYRSLLNKFNALDPAPETESSISDAAALYNEYVSLESRRTQLEQDINAIDKEIQLLAPWGEFDPQLIKKCVHAGVTLTFHEMTAKKISQLSLSDLPYAIISEGPIIRFIVFHYGQTVEPPCEPLSIPLKSLAHLREVRAQYFREIDRCSNAIRALACSKVLLQDAIETLSSEIQFEQARLSLEPAADGTLLFCSGWFPVSKEQKVITYLDATISWYSITEPTADDSPPIQLLNNRFSQKFEPITKMFALPDYHELDPTPFFAPFFMFFYGMCLGDIGYGLLVFVAALILMMKTSQKLKPIFILGMFLGGATILNGFFLNSFFGAPLFDTPGVDGIAASGGAITFLGSRVKDGLTVFPAMTFAVYIGVLQMLLGILLQTINRFRTLGWIYAVQPFCYLPLTIAAFILLCKVNFLNMGTYTINSLSLGASIAAIPNVIMFALIVMGVIPFIFLNTPTMTIWLRPLKFIWEFYNFVNSIVSYGLSYLRLFALGLAGGLLGNAFNQIALMFVTNEEGAFIFSPLIIFTILIMLAGHTLNFGLSALGAYVHTVRLTFVEFYGALSFTGGGKPYHPLTSKPIHNQ